MPALGLRDAPDVVDREIPSRNRYYLPAVSTHLYLAVAFLAFYFVARFLVARSRTSRDLSRGPENREKTGPGQCVLDFAGGRGRQKPGAHWGPGPRRQGSHPSWTRGFVALSAVPSQHGTRGTLPGMDGDKGEPEDHHPWSAPAASRGVSSSSPKPSHNTPRSGPTSPTVAGRSGHRDCLHPRSRAGSCHSSSTDGSEGPSTRDKGKGPMAGDSGRGGHGPTLVKRDGDAETTVPIVSSQRPGRDRSRGTDKRVPRHFPRPPPPPPMTPPTLSSAFFPFQDRRPSYAVSIPPALDMSFIHQPNPEYGGYSTSADAPGSSPPSAAPLPRRRSYTRSVPIGIPVPTTTASASSSDDTLTSGSTTNTFSPSSYPPTSPLLPPPPPGQYDLPTPPPPRPPPSAPPEYEFVGGPGGPGVLLSQQEIDLQGEIISVVDGAGHGWKRHTRVYGGGVCLACVEAAARDGEQGGFYGDKVPLEDRR